MVAWLRHRLALLLSDLDFFLGRGKRSCLFLPAPETSLLLVAHVGCSYK